MYGKRIVLTFVSFLTILFIATESVSSMYNPSIFDRGHCGALYNETNVSYQMRDDGILEIRGSGAMMVRSQTCMGGDLRGVLFGPAVPLGNVRMPWDKYISKIKEVHVYGIDNIFNVMQSGTLPSDNVYVYDPTSKLLKKWIS